MATCAYCGETILFGGVKTGELHFCNQGCQSKGGMLAAAVSVPEDAVENLARQIHSGSCPRCQGPGPVDVHRAHWVWSVLVLTRWGSRQQVSCRRCAVKTQAGQFAFSTVFGWWGLPWGLIMTPIQLCRTASEIFSPPKPAWPSPKLYEIARTYLASQPCQSAAGARSTKPVPDQWEVDASAAGARGAKPVPGQWEADD